MAGLFMDKGITINVYLTLFRKRDTAYLAEGQSVLTSSEIYFYHSVIFYIGCQIFNDFAILLG